MATNIPIDWKSPNVFGLCPAAVRAQKPELRRAERHGFKVRVFSTPNPIVKAECSSRRIVVIRKDGETWEV